MQVVECALPVALFVKFGIMVKTILDRHLDNLLRVDITVGLCDNLTVDASWFMV